MKMKTARYTLLDGSPWEVQYDADAPCIGCGEPVCDASMGGTALCPWCDMGKCRYCGMGMLVLKEEFDGGRSSREWRNHMAWHRASLLKADPDTSST